MASGSAGHWPTHDRVSSSANHGGLEALICAVADARPSRRSISAVWRAARAAMVKNIKERVRCVSSRSLSDGNVSDL